MDKAKLSKKLTNYVQDNVERITRRRASKRKLHKIFFLVIFAKPLDVRDVGKN